MRNWCATRDVGWLYRERGMQCNFAQRGESHSGGWESVVGIGYTVPDPLPQQQEAAGQSDYAERQMQAAIAQ